MRHNRRKEALTGNPEDITWNAEIVQTSLRRASIQKAKSKKQKSKHPSGLGCRLVFRSVSNQNSKTKIQK